MKFCTKVMVNGEDEHGIKVQILEIHVVHDDHEHDPSELLGGATTRARPGEVGYVVGPVL